MEKVLVTGAAGFIGSYLVGELLGQGYAVTGLDNFSKYGAAASAHEGHPGYTFTEGDARDPELLADLLADCDHFIAGAAMIGGVSSFPAYPYDLPAANDPVHPAPRHAPRSAPPPGPAHT